MQLSLINPLADMPVSVYHPLIKIFYHILLACSMAIVHKSGTLFFMF